MTLELQDERNAGTSIEANFHGELREKQQEAVHELQKHDMGILSATTAFGKTVVGFGMLLFQGIRRSDFQIRKEICRFMSFMIGSLLMNSEMSLFSMTCLKLWIGEDRRSY